MPPPSPNGGSSDRTEGRLMRKGIDGRDHGGSGRFLVLLDVRGAHRGGLGHPGGRRRRWRWRRFGERCVSVRRKRFERGDHLARAALHQVATGHFLGRTLEPSMLARRPPHLAPGRADRRVRNTTAFPPAGPDMHHIFNPSSTTKTPTHPYTTT